MFGIRHRVILARVLPLLVVAAVVFVFLPGRGAGQAGPASAQAPDGWQVAGWSLVLFGAIALVTVVAWCGARVRGMRRIAAILAARPGAFLVAGSPGGDMAAALRQLEGGVRLRSSFVWSVDDDGLVLWQGGMRPHQDVLVSWARVAGVESATVTTGRRSFAAVAVLVADGSGVVRLPFLARDPRAPLFPLPDAGVTRVVGVIRSLAPAGSVVRGSSWS